MKIRPNTQKKHTLQSISRVQTLGLDSMRPSIRGQ